MLLQELHARESMPLLCKLSIDPQYTLCTILRVDNPSDTFTDIGTDPPTPYFSVLAIPQNIVQILTILRLSTRQPFRYLYRHWDRSTDSSLFSTSYSTKHRSNTYNTKTVNKIQLVWSIFIIALVKLRIFLRIFVLLSCNFHISNHPLRASVLHICILTITIFLDIILLCDGNI